MYGEHGRIGLITLATDTSVLPEYQRLMPEGVQVYPAPIILPRGEVTPAALGEMLEGDQLEQAGINLKWTGVQVIVFACTTGSLVHGPGWDQEIIARISGATGLPATTTATAVIEALRNIGAIRLSIATPYLPELNQIERDFFDQQGFEVLAIEGLGLGTDPEIGRLTPNDAERLAGALLHPDSDALFISCTNWHVVERVPNMEQRWGIPVVTSNSAGAWAALRAIGVDHSSLAGGRLFRNSVASRASLGAGG